MKIGQCASYPDSSTEDALLLFKSRNGYFRILEVVPQAVFRKIKEKAVSSTTLKASAGYQDVLVAFCSLNEVLDRGAFCFKRLSRLCIVIAIFLLRIAFALEAR